MKNSISLYVTWKNTVTRRRFLIGLLQKIENEYKFKYLDEMEEAKTEGFTMFGEFRDKKEYSSQEMFFTFKSRLPARKRADIQNFLIARGLTKDSDDIELLRETRGFLSTDTFEFLEQMPDINDSNFNFDFFLVGEKYYLPNIDCINLDDKIELVCEPKNEYDRYAIFVKKDIKIGYVPKCYSKDLFDLVKDKKIIASIKSIIKVVESSENSTKDIKINIKRIN